MKSYYPYDPSSPRLIAGEEHRIENGQILLNHIPYRNSIEIDGFKQTNSASILPNQFFCAYGEEYYYREANCIVRFHQQHNGESVRVTYQQVGTIITANDMNELKAHIEDDSIHNRYTLPAASASTRGGVRVGHGLSMLGDILSADAQNYTLPSATATELGGVLVESDENISRTIERYFPTSGETLPVHQIATAESLGVVKIGSGLSITEDGLLTADAQDFTLTPASADSLGGVKVGARLSIDTNGILSADALQSATSSRLGGVLVESDDNIARTIERYFPSVTADTEIIPALTSIPVATNESLGGVKVGTGLSITEDGILSADAQNFTLTPATRDSLGGVKIGARLSIDSLGVLSADTIQTFTLTAATNNSLGGVFVESDENISRTIQKYFPTVDADEIIPVLTSIPPATRDSLGGVIVGGGLTITENGLLTADAQNFTLTPATTDSLGGVMFLTDEDVESMLESYFGAGATDTSSPTIIGGSGYILPIATAEKLGGVKIGSGLSINASGILSASAQDYTLPAASSTTRGGIKIGKGLTMNGDTLNADAQTFTLTAATAESLGGVIVGGGLSIDSLGVLSADAQNYSLPTASASVKGGIKIGRGLTMTGEVLSADAQTFTLTAATTDSLGGVKIESDENVTTMIENYFPSDWTFVPALTSISPATRDSIGGVKVGSGLLITADGLLTADAQNFTLTPATAESLGGVKIGDGLTITADGLLSADAQNYTLKPATSSQLGGVKIGARLSITADGILSADSVAPYTLPAASDEEISAMIEEHFPESLAPEPFTLPAATRNSLGGIIVGDRLSISNSGVLSADEQSYTLPTASASTKGGVKIGSGLSIDSNGVLSADAQDYNLPTASASQLGGVKIGSGLTITNGILSASSATLPVADDEEISAIIENYFAYTVVGGA